MDGIFGRRILSKGVICGVAAAVLIIGTAMTPRQVWGQLSSRSIAYVANGISNTLTVVELPLNQVVADIDLPMTPRDVAADESGNYVIVVGQFPDSVLYVDSETLAVSPLIENPGREPEGVAVLFGRAYVANAGDGTVTVINVGARAIEQTIQLGDSVTPEKIAVSDDGFTIFVTDFAGDTVKVINSSGDVTNVAVGRAPLGIAATERFIYATNFGSMSTSALDRSFPDFPVISIPVGKSPISVAVYRDNLGGDGVALVANLNDNTISVINTSSNEVVDTIENTAPEGTVASPTDVAFAPNGDAYVITDLTMDGVPVEGQLSRLSGGAVPVGVFPLAIAIAPARPENSPVPTDTPTATPSGSPSSSPSATKTNTPTLTPTVSPTSTPQACCDELDCSPGSFCGFELAPPSACGSLSCGPDCRYCAPRFGPGEPCSEDVQCQDSLFCTDGVCCSSADCGAGRRCDVPGNEGFCSSLPTRTSSPTPTPTPVACCDSSECLVGQSCVGAEPGCFVQGICRDFTPTPTRTQTAVRTQTRTPTHTSTVTPTEAPSTTSTVTPTATPSKTPTKQPQVCGDQEDNVFCDPIAEQCSKILSYAGGCPPRNPEFCCRIKPTIDGECVQRARMCLPALTPTPTLTRSLTPTITPTPPSTPTPTLTQALTQTLTATLTPTVTLTLTATLTPTLTRTITATPGSTSTITLTPTITPTPVLSFTITPTGSITPTATPTCTPSLTPTDTTTAAPTFTVTATLTTSATVTGTLTPSPTPTTPPGETPTPSVSPTPSATPSLVPVSGICQVPGVIAATLVPCVGGSAVTVWQCLDRQICASDDFGRVMLGAGATAADGVYRILLSNQDLRAADVRLLLVASEVARGVFYRNLVSVVVSSANPPGPTEFTPPEVALDPSSEAAVAILEQLGLERYRPSAAVRVVAAVEHANRTTAFNGMSPEEAVAAAREVALSDQGVAIALSDVDPGLPRPRSEDQGCALGSASDASAWVLLGLVPFVLIRRLRRG